MTPPSQSETRSYHHVTFLFLHGLLIIQFDLLSVLFLNLKFSFICGLIESEHTGFHYHSKKCEVQAPHPSDFDRPDRPDHPYRKSLDDQTARTVFLAD
jgi:hypothetical protein